MATQEGPMAQGPGARAQGPGAPWAPGVASNGRSCSYGELPAAAIQLPCGHSPPPCLGSLCQAARADLQVWVCMCMLVSWARDPGPWGQGTKDPVT